MDISENQSLKKNSLVAGIGILSGLYILAIAFGIVSTDKESVHVPMWVMTLCGILFLTGGIAALGVGIFSRRTRDTLGAFLLTNFLGIFFWIAFGPGPRQFNGGLLHPAFGRAVFGGSAVVCLFLVVYAWERVFQKAEANQSPTTLSSWTVVSFLLLLATEVIVTTLFIAPDGDWKFLIPNVPAEERSVKTPSLSLPLTLHGETPLVSSRGDIISYSVESIWKYDFKNPRALAVDRFDNIYVGESYQGPGTSSRILKFNPSGILLGWWGKGDLSSGWHASTTKETHTGNGGNPGEFNYIFKITFDEHGNMYVIDRGAYYDVRGNTNVVGIDRVQRFDTDGQISAVLDNTSLDWHTEDKIISPTTVKREYAFDEPSCIIAYNEQLFVGSWKKNRLDVFDAVSGEPIRWLGKSTDGSYGWHQSGVSLPAPFFGTEIGAFSGVIDCRLYNNELSVVSYNSNPVVAVFDLESGKYLRGLSHSDGHKPQEIIWDHLGNLIFSDNYEGSIKFLNKQLQVTEKLQLGPGGDYFGVGDFAFNSKGILYFVEQQKQRVYEIKLQYR